MTDLERATADFVAAVEYWQSRCGVAEAERDELDRQLRDARDLIVERNGLYSRSQSELASVRAQLDAMRGNR